MKLKENKMAMPLKHRNGHDPDTPFWWVALNRSSAAASALPFPSKGLSVIPTPEQLIGLPTQEEQRRFQKLCLEAPIEVLKEEFSHGYCQSKIKSDEWAYLVPQSPQPPSRKGTLWSYHKDGGHNRTAEDGQHRTTATP